MQEILIWINTYKIYSFRIISANLIAINKNGNTLKNGIKWLDFYKAIFRLKAPLILRWEDLANVLIISAPFAAY